MQIKTSITHIKDGKEIIRGKKLETLVQKHTFTQSIFFLFTKRMPKPNEERMFDAILTSAIDHGAGTASALTARVSASAKNGIHTSLAAGILGFGQRHGIAVQHAMEFFTVFSTENPLFTDKKLEIAEVVAGHKEAKLRIPGFGHRVLSKDHRSATLLSIAKKEKLFGDACQRALLFEKELNKQSSKPIPLNIDGAIAAILCDMGFTPQQGVSVFLAARVPGLLAHICEEQEHDEGLRRLDEQDMKIIS